MPSGIHNTYVDGLTFLGTENETGGRTRETKGVIKLIHLARSQTL